MHTQNGALRWVDDRRGHQRTEYAAVGNGEVTAGQVIYGQLAVTAFHCQLFNILFDIRHAQQVNVTQHRSHQATWGRNRHAHVEVVVINHIVAIDGSIHFRVAFQRFNNRFHVEGHEAQTDTVTFFERFAVLLTQIHNRLHVDFVERGQHGGRVFRFQQTLGNAFTQTGHRYAFFRAVAQLRNRRRSSGWRFRFSFRRRARQMFLNVFAGQAAANAGAFNRRRVEAVFSQQTTDSRAKRVVALLFQRRLLTLSRGGLFGISFRISGFTGAVAFTQAAQNLTRQHGGAFVFQYCIQNAVR